MSAPDAPSAGASTPVADRPPTDSLHADSPGPDSRWGVLRHTYYRRIFFSQFISNVGTWTEMFAIQMFVAHLSGRLDDQGILGACQQVPIALFGILGGVTADRVNRRTLLVVTQILAGLVAVGVAIVSMIDFQNPRTAIHLLWLLGAVNGTVMAFNFPAWQVLIPRLVPKVELTRAITLNGIQFNLARVIGPPIAGYVLAWLGSAGSPTLLWFNALTFLLMAGVVMTTPNAPAGPPSTVNVKAQIAEALQFLLHNRGPRAVLIAQVLLSLLAAPLVRLLSNFVIDVYKLDRGPADKAGSMLLALQGIGAVIGGLALKFIPSWYPKHHFIPLSVAGLGLSITMFAATRDMTLGYIAMFICGWFWIWAFNQSWAAIQVLTPDSIRGRALSVATVCAFGATAVGVYVAGETGETLKQLSVLDAQQATQFSVLILSIPLFISGLVMMVWRVPEVDNMPRVKGASRRSRSLVEALTASEHRPTTPREMTPMDPGRQPI